MAFEHPNPPGPFKDAALRELQESGGPDERSVRFAHPLYYLPVKNLTVDGPVHSKFAGWQFLVVDEHGSAVAGEVSMTSHGIYETAIVRGSAVDSAVKASLEIQSLPAARRKTVYQLRKLRIPAIRIEAIWLRAAPFDETAGDTDLIYSYLTFQKRLKNKVLRMPVFLRIARSLAAQEVKVDSGPMVDKPARRQRKGDSLRRRI